MCHQQTNYSQQTIEQTKAIQDVVLPEVSKLNYALLIKKQGYQIQSFPEKRLGKRKWIHHSCQINIPVNGCYYKKGSIIDPSILNVNLEMFIMQLRKNRQWVYTSAITHNSTITEVASVTPSDNVC